MSKVVLISFLVFLLVILTLFLSGAALQKEIFTGNIYEFAEEDFLIEIKNHILKNKEKKFLEELEGDWYGEQIQNTNIKKQYINSLG